MPLPARCGPVRSWVIDSPAGALRASAAGVMGGRPAAPLQVQVSGVEVPRSGTTPPVERHHARAGGRQRERAATAYSTGNAPPTLLDQQPGSWNCLGSQTRSRFVAGAGPSAMRQLVDAAAVRQSLRQVAMICSRSARLRHWWCSRQNWRERRPTAGP
jgi:hypothetical protein